MEERKRKGDAEKIRKGWKQDKKEIEEEQRKRKKTRKGRRE